MRHPLFIAAIGMLSGVVGSFFMGHIGPAQPQNTQRHEEERPVAVRVPPTWDPALLGRVAALEQRVGAMANKPERKEETSNDAHEVVNTRQDEARRQYEQELHYLDTALADHANETRDAAWATALESEMSEALAKHATVARAECGNKNCVSTLSFDTPRDALALLDSNPGALAVGGCKGFIAIPPPPTHAGAYELKVLHNCR